MFIVGIVVVQFEVQYKALRAVLLTGLRVIQR